MSTKTKPNRKYVAHCEKSKFFIFRPEISNGSPGSVWDFFFNFFLNPPKYQKINYGPT